jgi:hypothetical protein
MKRFFVISVLPYAVPVGEQGVGRGKATNQIKTVLVDGKRMCGETDMIRDASQSMRFCRSSSCRNNVVAG